MSALLHRRLIRELVVPWRGGRRGGRKLRCGKVVTAPVIGITAYADRARWDIWDLPATLVPQPYVDAVVAAGGSPVVLPPAGLDPAIAARRAGFVFSPGPDVDPADYGAEPHPAAELRPGRDEAELTLIRAA